MTKNVRIALVDSTKEIDPALVQQAAMSLNVQVTRDLPQFWTVQATVQYVSDPKHIPIGMWPIFLVKHLPAGEGGYHLDRHNQPYAKVLAEPKSDGWTIAASHELVEMLVDPYGNRLENSRSIEVSGQGVADGDSEFDYLVEACDPCEADQYAYTIQGIAVSDFITPHFYDPVASSAARYSFTGAIKRPREILPGGYISWLNHDLGEWQQLQFLDPNAPPVIKDLGPANARSIREWMHTRDERINQALIKTSTDPGNKPLFNVAHKRQHHLREIAGKRGAVYGL
jgi:hypothetical protein